MVTVTSTGSGNAARRSPSPSESIFGPEYRTTTIGIVISVTLIAFEAMAVATALPTAARHLHGLASYGWAFTGFFVAGAIGMVGAGLLTDRRGPQGPLILGSVGFVAGLVVAALAGSMPVLIAARFVQGGSTGMIITAIYVVMGSAYPDRIRPRIFTAVSSAWVVPGLVGPIVAGWVTEAASWRWVFGGLAPFAVLGGLLLVPSLRRLAAQRPASAAARPDRRADLRRLAMAVLAGAGVAAVADLGVHPSAVTALVAALGLVALVIGLRELLPNGTASLRPGVPAAVGYRGVSAGVFAGMESIVPLTLTVQRHYSATTAGLPLMISALAWAAASWLQGRMTEPNRSRLMAIGLAFIGAAALGMVFVAARAVPGWAVYLVWPLGGFGAGFALTSASVVMLEATNDVDRGSDSASLQLADSTFSALFTAFAGALVATAAQGHLGYGTALPIVFGVIGVVTLASMVGVGNLRAP